MYSVFIQLTSAFKNILLVKPTAGDSLLKELLNCTYILFVVSFKGFLGKLNGASPGLISNEDGNNQDKCKLGTLFLQWCSWYWKGLGGGAAVS